MEERRKSRRHHVVFYARVYIEETGALLGYLENLSLNGMMVVSDRPISPGKTLTLGLELPQEFNHQGRLQLSARVVWCRADKDPDFYNTGFEITAISAENCGLLERIFHYSGTAD